MLRSSSRQTRADRVGWPGDSPATVPSTPRFLLYPTYLVILPPELTLTSATSGVIGAQPLRCNAILLSDQSRSRPVAASERGCGASDRHRPPKRRLKRSGKYRLSQRWKIAQDSAAAEVILEESSSRVTTSQDRDHPPASNLRMASPGRTVPETSTRTCMPRRLCRRPAPPLTQANASAP